MGVLMLTLEYSLIKYKTIKTKLRTLLDEYFPEHETIFYDILGSSSLSSGLNHKYIIY